MQEWILAVSAIGLAVSILVAAVGMTWRLSRVELRFAEKLSATEAKVYQVEIWVRDEFVRKGSFEIIVARMEKSMELLGAEIEGAVEKMTSKLEGAVDKLTSKIEKLDVN